MTSLLTKLVEMIPNRLAKILLLAVVMGGVPVVYAFQVRTDQRLNAHINEQNITMTKLTVQVEDQTAATRELSEEIRGLRQLLAERALARRGAPSPAPPNPPLDNQR